MPSAFENFLRENTKGPAAKLALASYLRDIATADNKWKAILKTVRDLAVFRIAWPIALLGTFTAMGRTVRAILHDTGSLEAALKRMATIQGFQRQFAPLLGGLNAARQRVAELVQFTAKSKLFPLEDVGAASRELEVLTRGVFSNTEALGQVQNVAARSGNGIADVASAVGHFYDDLREGRPIDSATEQLRQMGVISQITADHLNELRKNGAGAQQIFGELTNRLGKVGPGGVAEDLTNIQRQHGEAAENLKQQFGAPFTQDEIRNTKNWTDAMNAVAPTVGRVSGFFANLVDGLSTFYSWVAKSAAETPVLQKAIEYTAKGIGLLAAAISIMAAIRIPMVLMGWASAITGVGVAATAARTALVALSVASGILAAVAVIGTAVGVMMNYQKSVEQAAEEVRQLAAAHREAQAAIDAQSASIRTLADQHEALSRAIENEIKLQSELNELNRKPTEADKDFAKIRETQRALDDARKKRGALQAQGLAGLTSPEQEERVRQEAQRRIQQEEEEFQAKLTRGSPEGREAAIRARAEVIARREADARAGAGAREEQAKQRAAAGNALLEARRQIKEYSVEVDETERRKRGEPPSEFDLLMRKRERDAERDLAQAGLNAPETSSVYKSTLANLFRLGQAADAAAAAGQTDEATRLNALAGGRRGTPEQIARLDVEAEMARHFEEQTESRAAALEAEAEETRRGLRLQREAQTRELTARQRERRGDFGEAISLRDLGSFVDEFEANRRAGFSQTEGTQRALEKTRDDILQSQWERLGVVDSLQRIGLGGNIGAADPALEVARRQEELLRRAIEYLAKMTEPKTKPTERVVAVYGD